MKKDGTSLKKRRFPLVCILIYAWTLVSVLLYIAFTKSAAFADAFNGSVAATGRRLLAYLFAWVPFSVAELLICMIPVILILLIFIAYRHFCDSRRNAAIFAGMILCLPAVILCIFVWNFAPGYYGTTLDQKLSLDRKKVSAEELYATADYLAGEIRSLEDEIVFLEDGSSLMPYSYDEMNRKLLDAYEKYAAGHDFIDTFYSRVKPVALSEPMSYTHITGVYTFFTGEANINVNFPDYTVPYTAAHELAHQRGIAREDEANFIAFLICMESDDPYIRYSACLNVYEYVLSALGSADRELYKKSYLSLPENVHREEAAYSLFFDKYRDNVASDVSQSVNNSYLQSQGAPEGTRSYNMVVDLAVAYYKSLSAASADS